MTEFEIENLYDDIKKKATAISSSAEKGCDKAKRVIELHRMCARKADLPTVSLLSCAFSDWLKAN